MVSEWSYLRRAECTEGGAERTDGGGGDVDHEVADVEVDVVILALWRAAYHCDISRVQHLHSTAQDSECANTGTTSCTTGAGCWLVQYKCIAPTSHLQSLALMSLLLS